MPTASVVKLPIDVEMNSEVALNGSSLLEIKAMVVAFTGNALLVEAIVVAFMAKDDSARLTMVD